ncbi:MAG: hypothetical protein JWQ97_3412 [Phenylobacterium sp.]|nr:hypothetical protein [Phenylobacterium sp.]
MTEARALRPFFEPSEAGFVPSALCGSPWGPGQVNGAAVGGLMAQTLIDAHPPQGMNIARFTLDILRPPPMAPMRATWRPLRDGRRTVVLEGWLTVGETTYARASALFVRRADEGAPATVFTPPSPLPEEVGEAELMMSLRTGMEPRLLQRGSPGGEPRLGRAWIRPLTQVVAGRAPDPFVAAAMAADFGGGLSNGIDRSAWISPNIDIAIHFVRPPRDLWILSEATTLLPGNGSALTESQLSDRFGPFGRAHQILAVTAVRPRAEAGA